MKRLFATTLLFGTFCANQGPSLLELAKKQERPRFFYGLAGAQSCVTLGLMFRSIGNTFPKSPPQLCSPGATYLAQAGATDTPPIMAGHYSPKTQNALYYYHTFSKPLHKVSGSLSWVDIYFSNERFYKAYAAYDGGNIKQATGNFTVGLGLTLNGFLLASGGGSSLSPSYTKNTIYALSTGAALFEAKDQFKQAYDLWNTNRFKACQHILGGSIFSTCAFLPFALDHYNKKSVIE